MPSGTHKDAGAAGVGAPADFLLGPGLVATPTAVLPAAGVLVRGGLVSDVGEFASLEQKVGRAMPRLDAAGGLILPGLINAHTHFYSALALGLPLRGAPPARFTEILARLWWRVDRALTLDDVETSAWLGLIECARCGVTTVCDHHSSPNACEGSLDRIRHAVEGIGLRAALCYEVSDRNGRDQAQAGIAENARFARALRERPSEQVRALCGLHALFTVSDETLDQCLEVARAQGIGLHLHLAEDRVDVEHSLQQYGVRPVHRLQQHGALGERTLAAHGVHVTDEEITLLAESRTFLAHNPESNMNNAVGCARVPELLERGVRVGLGTDGMSADLLATARTAFLIQRHECRDPRIGWAELPALLWQNNAQLASALFGRPVGVITPGAAADLIVLDYDPPTPVDVENLAAHLVFGFGARHVSATIVGGHVIMHGRRLLTVDEGLLRARAREQARRLWDRV